MNKFTAIIIILILTLFLLQFIIKNSKLKQIVLLGSFILSTGGAILMDTVTTNLLRDLPFNNLNKVDSP